MPLKIIGAGWGRTGTMSLYIALNKLGFPCYHMIEIFDKNPEHVNFWREVANAPEGTQFDWERVFANYTAAVDNPACCVWRELIEAYPDAKVILTLHPKGPGVWYESTMDTIYFTENKWQFRVMELTIPFFRKFGEMQHKLIWGRALRGAMSDRAKAVARYQAHIEEVKAAIPPERLLVFSVDQGWEPLCKFLELPVPDGAFPNVNERAQLKKRIAGMERAAYGVLGGAVAVIAVVVWGAMRLF